MLVLSRKPGQSIRIGDDVIVKVVRISTGGVRLAIIAPDHINIVREEIADRFDRRSVEANPDTAELAGFTS